LRDIDRDTGGCFSIACVYGYS